MPLGGDSLRAGGLITMIAGLLLFFGAISRIGKVSEAPLLSAPQREDPQKRLEESRQRIVAVYGLRSPAAASAAPRGDTEREPRQPPAAISLPPPASSQPAPASAPQPVETPRPVPTSPQPEKKHYIVQPGDTLWGIAQREYGDGNLFYIVENANPGLDVNRLQAGQSLIIPALPPALTLGQERSGR